MGAIAGYGAWPPDALPGQYARHHPESLCGVRMDPERNSGGWRTHACYFTDDFMSLEYHLPIFQKSSERAKIRISPIIS
jgi:hypothetical protein